MNREQLEHVIRAAGAVSGDDEVVIIGSQAILGQYPDAPAELLVSMEVDLFPKNKPALTVDVDGAIGELSSFHTTFGYYAHGVSEETGVLPTGWQGRLVAIRNSNTQGTTGWCLEAHDLAVSKMVAGRSKDWAFVGVLLRNKLVNKDTLKARICSTSLSERRRTEIASRIEAAGL